MPRPVVVTISHTLSRQDAISRLRERIGTARQMLGEYRIVVLRDEWTDNRLRFRSRSAWPERTGAHRRDGRPFSRRTAIALAARRLCRAYRDAGAEKSSAPPRPGWQQDGQSLAQLACLSLGALTARRSKGRSSNAIVKQPVDRSCDGGPILVVQRTDPVHIKTTKSLIG